MFLQPRVVLQQQIVPDWLDPRLDSSQDKINRHIITDASIPETRTKHDKQGSKFVLYDVCITCADGSKAVVSKRFSEFQALVRQLQVCNPPQTVVSL